MERTDIERLLSELFGGYRAEWLNERIFELFTTPAYFPQLTTSRPSVLIGGRGTGKTTVLRGLSYEGQFALAGQDPEQIAGWPYYGMYYRVDTNRVQAFRGAELEEPQWVKVFGHYVNLLMAKLLLDFLKWYRENARSSFDLPPEEVQLVADALCIGECSGLDALAAAVRRALVQFEAYVNNVADAASPRLSMQGAGLSAFIGALTASPEFAGKTFFFLVDEYENLQGYQQEVINTLIKHGGGAYTFKIGVRELGWRRRATLNANERLMSPMDYDRVDIGATLKGEVFRKFAEQVCNHRLSVLAEATGSPELIPNVLLPRLSAFEEAERLGGAKVVERAVRSLRLGTKTRGQLRALPTLDALLILSRSEGSANSVEAALQDREANPKRWHNHMVNYGHSLLFTIRAGRGGLQKFYAGWDTIVRLAGGNIRYVLQLLDNALIQHLRNSEELGTSIKLALETPISAETQTQACELVARKNLAELEGLAVEGAQLAKLLLGLGRIFHLFASQAIGHAPEINQFYLRRESALDHPREDARVREILDAAVMHLALLRFDGTKATNVADTRDYDYAIHPIFSPFFVFSYRRKRKMGLTDDDLLGLVFRSKATISKILKQHNRGEEPELPRQLLPFRMFYQE
jgi:hypothetical protein